MRIEHFRYLFARLNGFYLKEHVIFFRKPVEIWNEITGESVVFQSVDKALDYVLDGESVRSIIERSETLYIPPVEGRGRSKGGDSSKTFKFNHADQRGQGKNDTPLLPAQANTRIQSKTLSGALAEFKRNHLFANREFAYEVDDDGYVHQYVKGAKHSVAIGSNAKVARGQKTMIVHNHPSGGAFSDADLLSTSMDRRSKGIIASGKNFDYVFEKGSHFKATAFMKAVKSAQMKGKDYDDAVHTWLTQNAKKFGYKYTRTAN